MGNILSSSYSSPLLSHAHASFNHSAQNEFDVFINHRGKDTKNSAATLIYHNLQNKGFKVFLDKKSIQTGKDSAESIVDAIRTASVHVVIFSKNYAQSEWCLDELLLMLKTGAAIVPLFWEIKPSEVRMKDKDGVYARVFETHEKEKRFSAQTLKKWKEALFKVSLTEGYIYKGDEDQGEILEKIAMSVTENFKRQKATKDQEKQGV